MATFYSGWVASDDWRLRLDVSVATSNGSYTYTANLYCQSTYATLRNSGFSWSINIAGQVFSGTKTSPNIYPGGTSLIATVSKAVARSTSAKTVSFRFYGSMPSASIAAYRAGITGTGTQSLPALPSHTVSYNANGGSGAPGNQTKWYGSILTLSTTKPTRTGYTFRFWNTASNGSGWNYSPGAQYGDDVSVTMYAQWTEWTYTVSYNANGGTGAPGNQTKRYTATLTLSSTVPTRANYNFKGWATSPTGAVAYRPGSGYTTNASVTLYAVWEIAYIAPIITNVSVDRCDSAGTVADDGTYLKVSFKYQLDATYSGGMDYIQLSYKLSSASSYGNATTYTPSGMSGSFSQVIGSGSIDTEYAYDVQIIVKDHKGSTTATRSVGPLAYIIDFSPQGGVSIGEPAPNEKRFYVHVPATFNPKIPFSSLDLGNAAQKNLTSGATVKNRVPYIRDDGVMEVGKYIDFHDNNTSSDYSVRIEASGSTLVIDTGNLTTSSATINNLNWTGSGLRGRVMKQLWSGTWTSGSITVPDLPHYNVFVASFNNDFTQTVIGVRNPSTNRICFFGNYGNPSNGWHYAQTYVASTNGSTMTLLKRTMLYWNNTALTRNDNGVGFYRLWGVL